MEFLKIYKVDRIKGFSGVNCYQLTIFNQCANFCTASNIALYNKKGVKCL